MLNLFSNNVKSLFSSEKNFHKDILFSLTYMLTTVSEGYKMVFFNQAFSVLFTGMQFF